MSGFIRLDGSCKSFGSVQWANAKSALLRKELHKPHVLRSQINRLSERNVEQRAKGERKVYIRDALQSG